MKTRRFALGLAAVIAVFLWTGGEAMAQTHVMAPAADAKWGPAPPALPPGAQVAVLAGDPGKAAPYTIRVKFPANYSIAAHSHPNDENVVVVSGELFLGMGAKLDTAAAKGMGVGAYVMMPANMNHFAFTKGETTIVLFGTGPLEFKYVNAADDPRTKK